MLTALTPMYIRGSHAAITIETVPVGNPGNAADTTGAQSPCAAVDYTYNMGKYEVTNAQYAALLNAVDAGGTNPNGLYNASMGSDPRGGIWSDAQAASGSKYSTRTNMANKPVIFVSWFSALRFANWLHNGHPTDGSGTEDGAYDLTPGVIDARNPGAKWLHRPGSRLERSGRERHDGGHQRRPERVRHVRPGR